MGKRILAIPVAVVLVAVLAVGVALLSARGRDGGGKPEIIVWCGGSMMAALEEIVERYKAVSDDRVLATYGGSAELYAQLQRTEECDIFICHDPFIPWAENRGLLNEWKAIGQLELVIAVAKGNPKGIGGIEDLARPGVRIGVGDRRYSISGAIFFPMLKGIECGDAILGNIRLEDKGHPKRAAHVSLGQIDAGIIWRPVALQFRDKLDIVPIQRRYVDAVTSATYQGGELGNVQVTVGITRRSKNNERVRSFYEFVTVEGAKVCRKRGFTRSEE